MVRKAGLLGKWLPDKKLNRFKAALALFKSQALAAADHRFEPRDEDLYPCLDDATGSTGFDPHYIYHTAWAARRIRLQNPARHVDLSSYLYFSTLLSAFVPVEFFDYRPADIRLSGFKSGKADLNSLPFADNTVTSLSCMHTVEHVGLGRYGDEIDPTGDLRAIRELARVLAPGGHLYFVVPVGAPRLCFNAHRIYSYEQIVDAFSDLELLEFSLIPDNAGENGMIEYADPALVAEQRYACGCFIFSKPEKSTC